MYLMAEYPSSASPNTQRDLGTGQSVTFHKELLLHASSKEAEVYAHPSKESTRSAVENLDIKPLLESVPAA